MVLEYEQTFGIALSLLPWQGALETEYLGVDFRGDVACSYAIQRPFVPIFARPTTIDLAQPSEEHAICDRSSPSSRALRNGSVFQIL
jgi:hypothetical protein